MDFFVIISQGLLLWDTVIQHLRGRPYDLHARQNLSMIRRRIECDGNSATAEQLEQLIDIHPKELAFSLFLCTIRFPNHSRKLLKKIFKAIENYSKEQMEYCIQKFQGDKEKEMNADTVIGEAMTLIFSFFDNFVSTSESGNLEAIRLVKQYYPKSILYIDAKEFTPLHGVCCALNMDIFRYFINWHLEQDPKGRGGLYIMNDSGITPMDTLIDTQQNIGRELSWLCSHTLLQSNDVEKWLLIHRSAHSSSPESVKFFVDLYPSGVLSEDDDGNLPIHLHLGLRFRPRNSFSDDDFAIARLLITEGIKQGGIKTIGGLFHEEPDEVKSCTLDALLKEVGPGDSEKVWKMIDECHTEATSGDYTIAPIVHAAILNRKHLSSGLFENIMSQYEVTECDEYGDLPLMYAVKQGAKWDGYISHLLKSNLNGVDGIDNETGLPIVPFAASREDPDISMIYELTRRSPWMFV